MNVILNESVTARDGDFDGTMSTYLNDENTVRLSYSLDNYEISSGWDEIGKSLDWIKENADMDLSGVKISKENQIVKVTGNTAWSICDNIWKGEYDGEQVNMNTIQITFLEKADGEWKISFVTWLPKPETEKENLEE